MQVDKLKIFEMQADLCGIMANPRRLMIMDFLSRRTEACVGDIAEEIESTVSSVSQHLRLMRNHNIVTTRRDGNTIYYSLKHPKIMSGCLTVREVLMDELKSRHVMAGAMGS